MLSGDWLMRVDDFVASVERIADAAERIANAYEKVCRDYDVAATKLRDSYRPGADASDPANVLRSDKDDRQAGA